MPRTGHVLDRDATNGRYRIRPAESSTQDSADESWVDDPTDLFIGDVIVEEQGRRMAIAVGVSAHPPRFRARVGHRGWQPYDVISDGQLWVAVYPWECTQITVTVNGAASEFDRPRRRFRQR
ncbi:hypothetical protein FHU39_001649 [Flexivirga oryzae]|uniref:Uncharacterized protein n=1 Tax=Flexivirga oryzae TaxID=1794944 RepID=A0A839N8Y6_9MICO|nr:hypothetical protein [Flexivirga oryzae]